MILQHHDSESEIRSDGTSVVCPSSPIIGSPLWPQSFGRTMDIYSRSKSQRSEIDSGLDGISNAFEPTSSPTAARNDSNGIREPLLKKSESYQSENKYGVQSTEEAIHLSCYSGNFRPRNEQGSSFFQSLFNGMNVLAGEYVHPCILFFKYTL